MELLVGLKNLFYRHRFIYKLIASSLSLELLCLPSPQADVQRTIISSVAQSQDTLQVISVTQQLIGSSTLHQNTVVDDFGIEENKAQESRAKQTIGSMNRAQQAYFLERGTFATTIEQLGISINPETKSYRYRIVQPVNKTQVIMTAQAKRPGIKSYTGIAFVIPQANTGEYDYTIAGICETAQPSTTPPLILPPTLTRNKIQCPVGSRLL